MTRICFFLATFRGDGVERVTTVIASEIARCGHAVYILSASQWITALFPLDAEVRLASLEG